MPVEMVRELDQLAETEFRTRSNMVGLFVREGLRTRSAPLVEERDD
jgi:hypothetical protein